jgi:protease I
MKWKGATYTGNPVEVDGHIVTANGPEAAEEFAQAVVKLMYEM